MESLQKIEHYYFSLSSVEFLSSLQKPKSIVLIPNIIALVLSRKESLLECHALTNIILSFVLTFIQAA